MQTKIAFLGRLSISFSIFCTSLWLSSPALADKAALLRNDQDALQARVDLIQQAKEEIIVEYFSVWNDNQSIGGMALLIDAAQRGVKVKIIMDALSNTVPRALFAALAQKGVDASGNRNLEVRVYNQVGINLFKATHRDHAKMLVIDNKRLISGGRNVGDKYFGLNKERNFHDLDLIAEGEVAVKARQNFFQVWNSKLVEPPALYEFSEKELDPWTCRGLDNQFDCDTRRESALKEIDQEEARLRKSLNRILTNKNTSNVRSGTNKDWLADVPNSVTAEFVSHDPEVYNGVGHNELNEKLVRVLLEAKSEANIISPYLIPTARLMGIFKTVLSKGVKIRIITNSLKSTDNLFAQAGYRAAKKEMIEMGLEIYEYNGPDTVHAKTAVIDNELAIVGTYNIDPRSAYLNREIGMFIRDQNNNKLIQDLNQTIEDFRGNSMLVGKDGVEHNKDKEFEGVSSEKQMMLKAVMLMLPLIKNQI